MLTCAPYVIPVIHQPPLILIRFQFIKSMFVMLHFISFSLLISLSLSFKSLCAVAEATSGEDALRLCDQGMRPTVILSDVMMPGKLFFYFIRILECYFLLGMDGYTFMKRLRERKDTSLYLLLRCLFNLFTLPSELLPVIFLTAKAGEDARVDGLVKLF